MHQGDKFKFEFMNLFLDLCALALSILNDAFPWNADK